MSGILEKKKKSISIPPERKGSFHWKASFREMAQSLQWREFFALSYRWKGNSNVMLEEEKREVPGRGRLGRKKGR